MMRLKDRVALITGAASGIGRATAVRLAQEGARIAVADINPTMGAETVQTITEQGGTAVFIPADVSRVEDCERAVADSVSHFGQLNILVNNAAIMLEKNAVDTTEAEFDRLIGVNLKGTFFCAKYAVIQFRKQGQGGVIVNMASVNSFFAEGGIAAYCASKGGIAQLTRALAMDHSIEGIRVNGICPGWIETPMNAKFFALGPHIREQASRLHALGRIGAAEEVASGVVYLASDDAAFVTGSMLTIDGGFSAGLAPAMGIVV
ncbi:MAG: glucose 1-dehydrogenase [Anaerolineae bacterium]|nr:glucose 1-dehydrogenase [Anaerolineae bacterium]NUQ04571.1 glucose 1-dehydrogenase [Anaerolineae bacterium]